MVNGEWERTDKAEVIFGKNASFKFEIQEEREEVATLTRSFDAKIPIEEMVGRLRQQKGRNKRIMVCWGL